MIMNVSNITMKKVTTDDLITGLGQRTRNIQKTKLKLVCDQIRRLKQEPFKKTQTWTTNEMRELESDKKQIEANQVKTRERKPSHTM